MANVIRVRAGDLADALADACPKRKKKHKVTPVSLEFYEAVSQLAVIEAFHGEFQNVLPAYGEWPHVVQIDGVALYRLMNTYDSEAKLELLAESNELVISKEKSKVRLPRLDDSADKKIQRVAPRRDPRHRGMPKGIEDPLRPDIPQNETWDFSAHMVMKKRQK